MFSVSKLVMGNTSFNFHSFSSKLLKLYIIEIVLFLLVIILAVTNVIGFNLSIEFTGGNLYEVENINAKKIC